MITPVKNGGRERGEERESFLIRYTQWVPGEGVREGGREERERKSKGGEKRREGGRKGEREGGKERGRENRREGGRKGGKEKRSSDMRQSLLITYSWLNDSWEDKTVFTVSSMSPLVTPPLPWVYPFCLWNSSHLMRTPWNTWCNRLPVTMATLSLETPLNISANTDLHVHVYMNIMIQTCTCTWNLRNTCTSFGTCHTGGDFNYMHRYYNRDCTCARTCTM